MTSSSCLIQRKEHKQSRMDKENTAQAESQEVGFFPADVHQSILNKINK